MNRSERIDDLAAALATAQGAMEAASKDKTNPHFKSKYADLASIWDAIREPLSKNGLSVVQLPEEIDGKIRLTTMLLHKSGQWIEAAYSLPPTKNDPQGFGSAITYMRRYALSGVGVAPEDDDGNDASARTLPQSSPYSANPAPRNGNGNPINPKDAAAQWKKAALDTIKGIGDLESLKRWEDNNRAGMAKLQSIDRPAYDNFCEALSDHFEKLTRTEEIPA